jgi:hypothetical protein
MTSRWAEKLKANPRIVLHLGLNQVYGVACVGIKVSDANQRLRHDMRDALHGDRNVGADSPCPRTRGRRAQASMHAMAMCGHNALLATIEL